jgi:amino acid transporter
LIFLSRRSETRGCILKSEWNDHDEGDGGLRRVLGPFSATCVVVGAIVGIGIFFTPEGVAKLTGSATLAMAAWTLGGLIALAGALTFAELGGMYPRSGAQYAALRDAWSAPVGFAYVFCNATYIQAGAIAIIGWLATEFLLIALTGQSPEPGSPNAFQVPLIAAILIAGLALANLAGVRQGATIQNATVVAKLLTLAAITVLALAVPPAAEPPLTEAAREALEPTARMSTWALVFAGLIPVFFSFGGWQHALWIGGEVRDARRTVPIAIGVGVLLVMVVYLSVNWAYFRLLGFNGVVNGRTVASNAVATVLPGLGQRLVAGAVAVSAIGVLNAQLLSGPRLIYGMARDGRFFRPFARTSRAGTPLAAIVFLAALGLLILAAAGSSDRIDQLLAGVVTVDAVFFLITGLALFRLRGRQPAGESFRTPLFPLVPTLFAIGEGLVLVGALVNPSRRAGPWIGLAWIAGSLLIYFLFFRKSRPVDAPA